MAAEMWVIQPQKPILLFPIRFRRKLFHQPVLRFVWAMLFRQRSPVEVVEPGP